MKKQDFKRIGLLVFFVGFLAIGMGYAGTTGKITGVILDQSTGEPLWGVNVMLVGTNLGAITEPDGSYTILNVPPGIYALRTTMVGYKTMLVENVRVSIDFTSTINAKLQPTVLETGETVTVVAERPLVRLDMTSSLSSVGADEIRNLPVQGLDDVLELQAGVVRSGGQLHIRGGRASEIAYWVDGVSTTDVFNGSRGLTVENSAIQELQVVSGTFNAEYGQAMSGIIKIITKEGGEKLTGDITGYVGDYVSSDKTFSLLKKTSVGIDPATGAYKHVGTLENPLTKINPVYNLEFNVGGPVPFLNFNKKLTFFANGRFYSDEGYLYGRRWFTTYGFPGNSSFVPLNPYERQSLQGKLVYKPTSHLTLKYNAFWNHWKNDRTYSQAYTYTPDAIPQQFGEGFTHIFELNHVLSQKTFYELRVNRFYNSYQRYLYENPYATPKYWVRVYADTTQGLEGFEFDPSTEEGANLLQQIITERRSYVYYPLPDGPVGYVHPDSNSAPTSYSFNAGGNDLSRYKRSTAYWVGKLDLTSQINRTHQMKTGFEFRVHELNLDNYSLIPKTRPGESNAIVPFEPAIPETSSVNRSVYTREPREFSAYIQDKIELKDLIINVGLRYDYFDANSVVMADPKDPSIYTPFRAEHIYVNPNDPQESRIPYTPEQRRKFMHKKSKPCDALSPRFGLSFPITDRGAIHFSYGHFFQIPDFQYLYDNPDFKVTQGGGNYVFGNAELKPQRTVQYEVGLQQQFRDDIGVDITVFYRDVRDWVGTSPLLPTVNTAVKYSQYENKDYENVRGFTFRLEKRMTSRFGARIDYTFQKAEGTYTNPIDAYNAYLNNEEKRLTLIPMGFDRPHTLNLVLRYQLAQWTFSLIGNYWSGTPYTPSFRSGEVVGSSAFSGLPTNSARVPPQRNVDLYVNRQFFVNNLRLNVFVNFYNVFDIRDAGAVYGDTGKPNVTSTRDPKRVGYDPKRVGTVEEWAKQPSWVSGPRQIQVGVSVGF